MKIAIEGCAHGDLDNIYDSIKSLEETNDIKIDLLICCGDFQSSRNEEDLRCMAVPPKYYNLCSFYKYYNGEKTAPILTIFIGGNHEASNYLQELPYGGWVAPNIYYLGYAGVINVAGIRIAGISGIYKGRDFLRGHHEIAPFNENTKRSVYHIRNLEVFRLKQLSGSIDMFLSHDWPCGIWKYGNVKRLLKFKPHFRDDIESGELGSPPCEELLNDLKPKYWFSAHLHCKFAALVQHSPEENTKFLALDKCLPNRRFLQVIDVPHDLSNEIEIKYDLEWLTILYSTNHLLSVKNCTNYMPGPAGNQRWEFTPTDEEKMEIYKKFNENLNVPKNFVKTVKGHCIDDPKKPYILQPSAIINPQTTEFCATLEIDDPIEKLKTSNPNNKFSDEDIFNNSLNCTSFIDDSINEEDDVGSSSFKRTSLSLPAPKDDFDYVNEDVIENKSKEKVVEEEQTEEALSNTEELTPSKKKFKRRNADIYDSEAC